MREKWGLAGLGLTLLQLLMGSSRVELKGSVRTVLTEFELEARCGKYSNMVKVSSREHLLHLGARVPPLCSHQF